MALIKHKVLVMSGKGGVGKSTLTTQLALALVEQGHTVGVLDVDVCGPSIPRMLGVAGKKLFQSTEGWVPVYADAEKRLRVVSLGFLVGEDDAVVWRGPKKTGMVRQFLRDVYWGELDFLLVDTPPGTSDEHITVCEALGAYEPDGVVMVTTPQTVALIDVMKEISFCQTIDMPILGLVENMRGFVCPCCGDITYVFGREGGENLAKQANLAFLGDVPLDPQLGQSLDEGKNMLDLFPDSPTSKALLTVVQNMQAQLDLVSSVHADLDSIELDQKEADGQQGDASHDDTRSSADDNDDTANKKEDEMETESAS